MDFLGMCLYVRQEAEAGARMHVLLLAPDLEPDAIPGANGDEHCSRKTSETDSGHTTSATDRHHPRLFYDAVHDGGADAEGWEFRSISLEDKLLDLSRLRGELDLRLDAVPDLTVFTGSPVAPRRLSDEPGDLVTARVSFAAGSGRPVKFVGPWELHGAKDVHIAHKIRWTLEFGEDALDDGWFRWELLGLNARGGQPLVPLRPVNGEINLRVMNVLRHELSPRDSDADQKPPQGFEMCHFKPFYAVLADPPETSVPLWAGPPGNGGPIGDNYTCGTASARG